MFVEKSMTRQVVTIDRGASVLEAKERMAQHGIRHLPVVDGENILIGIVTDRDVRTALPSPLYTEDADINTARERAAGLKVKDIMTENLVTISPSNTLEDALLLMQKVPVGAFPVVDRQGRLLGILSVRDLMRAFINVLGIEEPGTLLGILVEDKLGQMKRIVDAISEERIPFGSILVARHWEEGKRAVFPYLLTNHVAHVKKKLERMGFTLLDPMEWTLDQLPKSG